MYATINKHPIYNLQYSIPSLLQKKEPINKQKNLYPCLSALRLCIWLCYYNDVIFFYINYRFLFTFRTKQRETLHNRLFPNLYPGFVIAHRAINPLIFHRLSSPPEKSILVVLFLVSHHIGLYATLHRTPNLRHCLFSFISRHLHSD